MPTIEPIIDAGGNIQIRDGDRVIRIASVDGTRHADVIKAMRAVIESARTAAARPAAQAPLG